MVCAGSPTTQSSSRPPSQRSSSADWIGETSWNSSTTNHLYCRRTWAATRSSSASMPAVEQQDVLHVHPALGALDLLVAAEDPGDGVVVLPGDRAAAGGGDPQVVVGVDVADLGPLDLGGEVAQQRLVGADPLAPGGGGEQPDLGLDQGGQLGAVHVRPEVPQLAQRGRVEGAGLDAAGAERAQPPAHLAGGAGGEGDREDLGGRVDAGVHAVGDPVGDRAGLAGAGAGEHPDRARAAPPRPGAARGRARRGGRGRLAMREQLLSGGGWIWGYPETLDAGGDSPR